MPDWSLYVKVDENSPTTWSRDWFGPYSSNLCTCVYFKHQGCWSDSNVDCPCFSLLPGHCVQVGSRRRLTCRFLFCLDAVHSFWPALWTEMSFLFTLKTFSILGRAEAPCMWWGFSTAWANFSLLAMMFVVGGLLVGLVLLLSLFQVFSSSIATSTVTGSPPGNVIHYYGVTFCTTTKLLVLFLDRLLLTNLFHYHL